MYVALRSSQGYNRLSGEVSMIGVYKITLMSGHFYIGSSTDVKKRCKTHFRKLKAGTHENCNLTKHYKKGEEIRVEFKGCLNREHAFQVEDKIIKRFKGHPLLLNLNMNAKGGMKMSDHPLEMEMKRERQIIKRSKRRSGRRRF